MQGTRISYWIVLTSLKLRTKPGDFSFWNTCKVVPLCVKHQRKKARNDSCLFIVCALSSAMAGPFVLNEWAGSRRPYFRLRLSSLFLIQLLLTESLAFWWVLDDCQTLINRELWSPYSYQLFVYNFWRKYRLSLSLELPKAASLTVFAADDARRRTFWTFIALGE